MSLHPVFSDPCLPSWFLVSTPTIFSLYMGQELGNFRMKYIFIRCTSCPVGPLNLETCILQSGEIISLIIYFSQFSLSSFSGTLRCCCIFNWSSNVLIFSLFFFFHRVFYFFFFFLKKHQCERNVPWPRIKPTTFWCMDRCSNQLSILTRAFPAYFLRRVFFWTLSSIIWIEFLQICHNIFHLQEFLPIL